MSTPDYQSRLEALVEQIESALSPELGVAYGSSEYLLAQLDARLRNAKQPETLLLAWEKNAPTYAARANADAMRQRRERNLSPDIDLDVDPAFIDRQFGLCSEVCPPPVASSQGGSDSGTPSIVSSRGTMNG